MAMRWTAGRLAVAAAFAVAAGGAAAAEASVVVGPYKHAALAVDRSTQLMRSAASGRDEPLARSLPAGIDEVRWAFAVGDCGRESWGEGIETEAFARANVKAFVEAGIGYVVSTGGQGQQFRCPSAEAMEAFIARYDSPSLRGLDFDIEAGQSDRDIDALVRSAAAAGARHPRLRFSFTLPAFAASDDSGRSLNAIGLRVLAALRRHRFDRALVNLMAMDFGEARAGHCVLKKADGRPLCDMGRSALQAATNLHSRQGIAFSRIELTVMPGVNDVVLNVFSLDDAALVAREARALGLAGVHWWSLDRDTPCGEPPPAGASDRCSGVAQGPLAFGKSFAGPAQESPK